MLTKKTEMQDLVELDRDITPEDALEVSITAPGEGLLWSLIDLLKRSTVVTGSYTLRSLRSPDGKLLLVGGWDFTGRVWMLATVHAKDYPLLTMRGIRECHADALKECPRLYNMVMLSNKQHVKMLELLGAEFRGAIYGVGGEPFQAFTIE